MKKIIFISLLILSIASLTAQKNTRISWKNMIRVSFGARFNTLNPYHGTAYNNEKGSLVKFGLPTISFIHKTGNNDFHEANLNNIYISATGNRNSHTYNQFNIGASYTYNVSFIRKKQTIIQPFIGFGSNLSYSKISYNISPDVQKKNMNYIYNLQLICVPRIQVNIKKYFNLELSIPFDFFGYSSLILADKKVNSNKVNYYQHQSTPYFGPMDININLGIGYKF